VDWMSHPEIINAAKILRDGGVVAVPTESVWGLSCDANNEMSVRRLLSIKSRPESKGLILITDQFERLKFILGPFSRKTRLIIESSSVDHPITCLVPHNGKLSKVILGENEKVAVRVIKHPPARALCAHFGGLLVSTSANPNGQPAARTESKVMEYFLNAIDFVSPGSVGGADNVSEIIDVASGNVVRAR